jgi:aryl-alcohol dehydrogenase-like predicted oxidoreductase
MPAWVVAKANTLAELRGWTPFVGLQIEYSLIERTPERELLPMAYSLGLGITAWSPLAGGVLTGKYAEPKPGEAGPKRFDTPEMAQFLASGARATAIAREVQAVARECGRSPAQVALAWLRHRPVPVIPIIGARRLEQVKDNLGSIEVKLDQPHLDRLEEVSRVELGFPHDFYKKDMVRTIVFGGMRDLIDA